MQTLTNKVQALFESTAHDIYNTETLWIDEVNDDYISFQGNSECMYIDLKQYKPQLKALIKAVKSELGVETVWIGNLIL
jgi:hypothetical protein